MKQPKKLTLSNKKLLVKVGLNPEEWMVRFEDKQFLHIVNKATSKIRIIDKKKGEVIGDETD